MAFIPTKDGDFVVWADNLMGIVETHQEEFHIPQDQFTPLKGLHAAYAKPWTPTGAGGHPLTFSLALW